MAALDRALALAERERRCRARRRAAGSRRAAAARRSARRRRGRRRTPPSPRAARPRAPRRARPRARTTRIPRPPPPAAALTSSGKPSSSGSPLRDDRHAGLARDPLRLELVAAGAQRVRRRPDPDEPGRARPPRRSRRSRPGSRSRDGSRRRRVSLRGADVLLRVEVARDLDRLVRRARVQRAAVVGRATATVAMPERRAPCGRRAARSRRGWLRGACGSPQPGKRKQRRARRATRYGTASEVDVGDRAAERRADRLAGRPREVDRARSA